MLFEVVVATQPILALLLATAYLHARVRVETGRLRLFAFSRCMHRRRVTVGLILLLSALFLGILWFMDLLP